MEMKVSGKANRLKTTGLVKYMVDRYYADLKRAREHGRLICWCIGPAPFEPLMAMDIAFLHGENYGAYAAARKGERELKEAAEADAFSPDVCSYARITNGCALLGERGAPPNMARPDMLMPKPDLLFGTNPCPTMTNWFDSLRRFYNVPSFMVDIPFVYHESEYEDALAHVVRQLEDFHTFLEGVTGRRFDYERLKQIVWYVRKAAEVRKECLDMGKHIPSPVSCFDWFISLAPINIVRGGAESVDYFVKVKEELQERLANGVSSVPDEKYRLYWDQIAIWFKVGALADKFAAMGACVVAATYTHAMFYADPELVDPEKPLRAMAERVISEYIPRSLDWRINTIIKYVQDYSVDGLIMHSPRTCRPMDIGQYDIIDAVARRVGVPGMVLEADHSDPNYYSEAQVDTRLQAFIEMLEARKRPRRQV